MAQPGGGALPKFPGFRVHKLLGKGSYGKVYKVERESDRQLYALKEADLGSMSQAERGDAVNEVRLLVSINHHNVIRYNEAFLQGSKLCTVMEYAPFGDLRYYIAKGAKMRTPFPEEAVWRIFLQLCRGLQALHAANVVHRDIKPANIFLCANDLLKIGDLGIAKALHHGAFARTQIGTPCYMAPEVWSGRPYSYSSDMWSLGAVLYEMMTFKTPMEGRSMAELRGRIIAGRYTPVPPGRYSAELTQTCYALLAAEPAKRPSPSAVLASTGAAKWMHVLPAPPAGQRRRWTVDGGGGGVRSSAGALLDTIVVPRDLKQLPSRLPPPSYDSDSGSAPPSRAPSAAPSRGPSYSGGGGGPSAPPSKPPTPTGQGPAKLPSMPNSRAPSREHSRAPSPADVRPVQDKNRPVAPMLPPIFPRAPGGGYQGSAAGLHPVAAAAAAAAAQMYAPRWQPSAAPPVPFGGVGPRVAVPQRRVSYS